MTTLTVADVHAHIFPSGAAAAAHVGREWHGLNFAPQPDGSLTLHSRDGNSYNWAARYWEGAARRLEQMREQSVDLELLSISGSLLGYFMNPEQGLAAAREINDEIAQMCRTSSAFLGLGTLPLQDERLAVREIERVARDLGLYGIVVGANVNGELWDSPRLFPILDAAAQLGLFVLVHPDPWMYDRALNQYHVTEFAAHQSQVTYAAASLIFGGVLDRLPDLRVCLGQSGGFLSFLAGRLDQSYLKWPASQVASALPSAYLRRFHFDSLTYGQSALRFLVEVVGADRVLLGTDAPSSVYVTDPVNAIRGYALSTEEQDAILGRNFETMLTQRRQPVA